MDVKEIRLGETYVGGKNDQRRVAVAWGSSEQYVCWASEGDRLPLGGFIRTRCTETASFAKWAKRAAKEE